MPARLLSLCAALFLLTAAPAAAQQMQCGERDRVIALLTERLQQAVRARGIAGRAVMELHVAPESGDWTITVSLPNGMTCLLANGKGFEPVESAQPARGTPV